MHTIYTISHPFTNEVVYVGCSKDFEKRKYSHTSTNHGSSAIRRWILDLRDRYMLPKVEVLDMVNSLRFELYWINQLQSWGFNLLNSNKTTKSKAHQPKRQRKNETYRFEKVSIGDSFKISPSMVNSFKVTLRQFNRNHDANIFFKYILVGNVVIAERCSPLIHTIKRLSLEGETLAIYKGMAEVTKDGYDRKCVYAVLLGKTKTAHKFRWVEENKPTLGLEKGVRSAVKNKK